MKCLTLCQQSHSFTSLYANECEPLLSVDKTFSPFLPLYNIYLLQHLSSLLFPHSSTCAHTHIESLYFLLILLDANVTIDLLEWVSDFTEKGSEREIERGKKSLEKLNSITTFRQMCLSVCPTWTSDSIELKVKAFLFSGLLLMTPCILVMRCSLLNVTDEIHHPCRLEDPVSHCAYDIWPSLSLFRVSDRCHIHSTATEQLTTARDIDKEPHTQTDIHTHTRILSNGCKLDLVYILTSLQGEENTSSNL